MHADSTLKRKIKKLITGLSVPQEYCCLEFERLRQVFSVFLTVKNSSYSEDITGSHLLLGYKPLIIGLPFHNKSHGETLLRDQEQICLSLGLDAFQKDTAWCGFPAHSNSLARVILKKIGQKRLNDNVIYFYEGVYGAHKFLHGIHQYINHLLQNFKRRSPGNVGLPGNLLNQVRIGYSIPRRITVITTSDGNLSNMFPSDLHGPVGDVGYAGSLRIGGEANNQVEQYKKVVLSEVDALSYKHTYALGKNHMKKLQSSEFFRVYHERSKVLDFPLPLSVIKYYELSAVDSIDFGIHRIHLYDIDNQCIVKQDAGTLAHVHQYYAQWRIDRGLDTPLLIR